MGEAYSLHQNLLFFAVAVPAWLHVQHAWRRCDYRVPTDVVLLALAAGSAAATLAVGLEWPVGQVVSREVSATVVAPIVEESCKLVLLLWVLRDVPRHPRIGLVAGIALGAGFGLAENLSYATGMFGERGLSGGIFSAMTRSLMSLTGHVTLGIVVGVAWALGRPVAALVLVMPLHGVHNGLLVMVPEEFDAGMTRVLPIKVALFLAATAGAGWIARQAGALPPREAFWVRHATLERWFWLLWALPLGFYAFAFLSGSSIGAGRAAVGCAMAVFALLILPWRRVGGAERRTKNVSVPRPSSPTPDEPTRWAESARPPTRP